jgi:hypothetical protein
MLPEQSDRPAPLQTDQRLKHWLSPYLTERSTTGGTQDQNVHSLYCCPPRSASRYAGAASVNRAGVSTWPARSLTRFLCSLFPAAFRCSVPVSSKVGGSVALAMFLSVSACASVAKHYDTGLVYEAAFKGADRVSEEVQGEALDVVSVSEATGDAPESVSVYDVDPVTLANPVRLAMVGASGDVVLRRLAENTNLQWISETAIVTQSAFDLDIVLKDTSDVVALVDALAMAAGARTQWEGARVVFTKEDGGTRGQSDGYLIRGAIRSPELAAVVADRYGVQCTNAGTLALCVGPPAQLSGVRSMLAALEGQYGRVAWRVVYTPVNVPELLVTLGLAEDVTALQLSANRYLVASSSDKMLTIAAEALAGTGGTGCLPFRFTPDNVLSEDVQAGLAALGATFCTGPQKVGKSVMGSVPVEVFDRVKAAAAMADKAPPLAQLTVYVLNESDVKRAGVLTNGWDGLIPTSNPVDSISLSLALQRAAGWRSVEIVTDGQSEAAIQQTDRVEGDVVVTDGGSRVQGVEERTVGLNVSLQGTITPLGFRGRLEVNDSSLNQDIVTTARCSGFVSMDVGQAAKVCSYERRNSVDGIRLIGVEGSRNAERFLVVVALNSSELAPVETLKMGVR